MKLLGRGSAARPYFSGDGVERFSASLLTGASKRALVVPSHREKVTLIVIVESEKVTKLPMGVNPLLPRFARHYHAFFICLRSNCLSTSGVQ
jgi:hypothetical protein